MKILKQKWLQQLATPTVFFKLSQSVLPWLMAVALIILTAGLVMVLRSPVDYQQGITVKIMYLHVPFAWLCMLCYSVMSVAALVILITNLTLAEIILKSAASIGAIFTALALITGSLWGRPTWGTWWEWDARMTSVLILLFIYLAIIALLRAFDDTHKAAKAGAILTLVGFVNIPVIKFSVSWWNTLHQPASLFRQGGSAIDPAMLWPLLTMALGFTVLLVTLTLMATQNEILRRQITGLQRSAARKRSTPRDREVRL